jgi:NTE family protein
MERTPALARSILFAGFSDADLDEVAALAHPRSFAAGEHLCRAGDPADCVWVITAGLVHWLVPTAEGAGELLLRLRKGDVIGAQDAIAGEVRAATVVASIDTQTLEIGAEDFAALAERHPSMLVNLVRTQRERLSRAGARTLEKDLGEEIGLVVGPSLAGLVGPLVVGARMASTRPVSYLSRTLSFAGALTAADDAATQSSTVIIPGELDPATLDSTLDEVDRVVAVLGSAEEVGRLSPLAEHSQGHRLEVVLVGDEARRARRSWSSAATLNVVRECDRLRDFPLSDADIAWIARHLTATKLGIALGAGGAKGFAHVGLLQVLEENGYIIDYAAGSSIGGFVSTHVALGHRAAAIDERFRAAFDEETVSAMFSSPFGAGKAGEEILTKLLQEATENKSFDDTIIPLTIMAVDLTERTATPQREGPLWQALLAALSVAGVFPTQERDGHRLVDAIALVPVPTAAVVEAGADIVVSSNLMSAETLDKWPSGPDIPPPPEKKRRGALDTMLEVMDLSQLDTSTRLAALADVAVTPKFAPVDWRDFHLADLFLAAGRAAAEEQLPALKALSRPVEVDTARRESGLTTFVG